MKNNHFENELVALQTNMRNFAFTLTLNRNDAEDLLQETTLKVLDNQQKFVDNVNFKGWVLTIMKNIYINNYRRILRNQTVVVSTEDLYNLNLSQNSGFDSPEGSYAIREITNSIASFADEYRIPFSMHLQGFKYEEIAQKNNLPIGTVKSRIFLARKKLQEQLKDYRY
ncbi:MAG: RNA polymerase sigma factor [Paludibacter sp.]|nr:RNA polymerase sigma factor [Paludibacter sp.]